MPVAANQDWLRLDNAAKIYPAAASQDAPAVFRLSATFDKPIRIAELQQAYASVLARCPYFQVYLKRGVFWYYLQRHDRVPPIQLLDRHLQLEMPIHQRDIPLLRVQARGATMAIDFSHILTDGMGGMRFLTSVVAEYLRLCGIVVETWEAFLDPKDAPHPEEFEDGHKKHFERGLPTPPKLSPAYHLPGEASGTTPYRILSGRMPVADVLALAKSHKVSLTEYLVALYMDALARVREHEQDRRRHVERSVIRIEVPVNMRPYYASQTMRNFSLFVSPEIDLSLGAFTLEEIVRKVHLSMRMQLDRKELQRQISRNVAGELNPLIRVTPLALKDLLLSAIHRRWGSAPYSGVLSNLGMVCVPSEVSQHVEAFGCVLDPQPPLRKTCSVLSFKDELTVTFGSTVVSRELERCFFTSLTQAGVSIQVQES
jgi:hypothetical protein